MEVKENISHLNKIEHMFLSESIFGNLSYSLDTETLYIYNIFRKSNYLIYIHKACTQMKSRIFKLKTNLEK